MPNPQSFIQRQSESNAPGLGSYGYNLFKTRPGACGLEVVSPETINSNAAQHRLNHEGVDLYRNPYMAPLIRALKWFLWLTLVTGAVCIWTGVLLYAFRERLYNNALRHTTVITTVEGYYNGAMQNMLANHCPALKGLPPQDRNSASRYAALEERLLQLERENASLREANEKCLCGDDNGRHLCKTKENTGQGRTNALET